MIKSVKILINQVEKHSKKKFIEGKSKIHDMAFLIFKIKWSVYI